MLTVASVTPTLCHLFGIEAPRESSAARFELVASEAGAGRPISRALVFAADGIGAHLVRSYADTFEAALRHAPIRVEARAVMPSVTPVCFASMFTGAPPATHGIRKYERPVLACDTLFDALARAGRRVAIVAVRDCSIALIFQNRRVDYFIEEYDPEVAERTLRLIEEDRHDFILAYQQEYDDQMHRTVPRSPEALRAMGNHVRSFDGLATAARKRWAAAPHAVGFVTDHGSHVDPESGRGTHGSDMPDDLEVELFWGVSSGAR